MTSSCSASVMPDADGVVASNKLSEQIMAKYDLDQVEADIIAGAALSALGGVSMVSSIGTVVLEM